MPGVHTQPCAISDGPADEPMPLKDEGRPILVPGRNCWRIERAERLAFLGIRLDPAKNVRIDGDVDLSQADGAVRTLVIHAREDLEMARQAEGVLG